MRQHVQRRSPPRRIIAGFVLWLFLFGLIGLFATARCVVAFKTFRKWGGAVHEGITREAIGGEISEAVFKVIDDACTEQDKPWLDNFTDPTHHFDNNRISGSLTFVQQEFQLAVASAKESDARTSERDESLGHFGNFLHVVQDFYSHSNYVELHLKGGETPGSIPLIPRADWTSVPPKARTGYFFYASASNNEVTAARVACVKELQKEYPEAHFATEAQVVQLRVVPSDKRPTYLGAISYATGPYDVLHFEINKDDTEELQGGVVHPGSGLTLHEIARRLAVAETKRQWQRFLKALKEKYGNRAPRIVAAISGRAPTIEERFSISAPGQVTVGEIASLMVTPSNPERKYHYKWSDPDGWEGGDSQKAKYQPTAAGSRNVKLEIYDESGQALVKTLTIPLKVIEPQTAHESQPSVSGQVSLRIASIEVKPQTVIPGELVDVNIRLEASGILNQHKDPHSVAKAKYQCQYRGGGKEYVEERSAMIPNGTTPLYFLTQTGGWAPGRYDLTVTAEVSGATAQGHGKLVIRQPDVQVERPPSTEESGQPHLSVTGMDVDPKSVYPGTAVNVVLHYQLSGIPPGSSSPLIVSYALSGGGKKFTKRLEMKAVNGKLVNRRKVNTTGLPPGEYALRGYVEVSGMVEQAQGKFVVVGPPPPSQPTPSPRLTREPPAETEPPGSAEQSLDAYVGDWEGRMTIVGGEQNGQQGPVRIRIEHREGAYRVYDLLDPNALQPPLQSRVENGKVIFSYHGPAVDTQGYIHQDIRIDVECVLYSDGRTLKGRIDMSFNNDRTVIDVQTTRIR